MYCNSDQWSLQTVELSLGEGHKSKHLYVIVNDENETLNYLN